MGRLNASGIDELKKEAEHIVNVIVLIDAQAGLIHSREFELASRRFKHNPNPVSYDHLCMVADLDRVAHDCVPAANYSWHIKRNDAIIELYIVYGIRNFNLSNRHAVVRM